MRIIYEDDHFCALDKPKGFFVHPPEASKWQVPRDRICLFRLREKLGRAVFPVHRLDAPTSGIVLFAFSKCATQKLSALFSDREIRKTYHAVARGFLDATGRIDFPLESARGVFEAATEYRTIQRLEIPVQVGNRYPSARYTLLEINPLTGRWHQIRRHLDRIAHPIVGDIEHGDSHHNRFFRDNLGIKGLCLRAKGLEFIHPWHGQRLLIEAPPCKTWNSIYTLFESDRGRSLEGVSIT